MSRRRFLALTGAGVATVAGAGALYGMQRLATAGASETPGAATSPDQAARRSAQRVSVVTRFTPTGVPYLAAVAVAED